MCVPVLPPVEIRNFHIQFVCFGRGFLLVIKNSDDNRAYLPTFMGAASKLVSSFYILHSSYYAEVGALCRADFL